MKRHAKYTPDFLARFSGIKVVVSRFVPDNKIVFRGNRHPIKPIGVHYDLTMWDLETGNMSGNLDPKDATEMQVSRGRYREIKDTVEDIGREVETV
jgi:hypothetical protein